LEIAPVPHRATRGERRRLALGLLVLTPVVLLVLLPAVFGLDRTVVTDRSMDGGLGRGSVVLARQVPPLDLRVGDVVAVRLPGSGQDQRVERRIVAIRDGVATVESDQGGRASRQPVALSAASYSRVWLGVPWIGYPFVVQGGWIVLVAAAFAALMLALAAGRRSPSKPLAQPRSRLSVG
jgi:signal peptidase